MDFALGLFVGMFAGVALFGVGYLAAGLVRTADDINQHRGD